MERGLHNFWLVIGVRSLVDATDVRFAIRVRHGGATVPIRGLSLPLVDFEFRQTTIRQEKTSSQLLAFLAECFDLQ